MTLSVRNYSLLPLVSEDLSNREQSIILRTSYRRNEILIYWVSRFVPFVWGTSTEFNKDTSVSKLESNVSIL